MVHTYTPCLRRTENISKQTHTLLFIGHLASLFATVIIKRFLLTVTVFITL